MERRNIEKHKKENCELRIYECPFCPPYESGYYDTYKKVTTEHFKVCDGYPFDCPNQCGEKGIWRYYMSSHLASCPEEVVQCRYQSIGCKVRLPRKLITYHMKDKDTHLEIAALHTTELVEELNRVKTEYGGAIDKLQKQVDALLKKTDTTVDLSPPRTPKPWLNEDPFPCYPPCTLKVKQSKLKFSADFITQPGGYRLAMKLLVVIRNISVSRVNSPNNYLLRWPIEIKINFLILNQEEDRDHYKDALLFTVPYTANHNLPRDTELNIAELTDKFTLDGDVYIRVESVDVQYKG
jgi:uncharacterized coiled-coil protein SlyX